MPEELNNRRDHVQLHLMGEKRAAGWEMSQTMPKQGSVEHRDSLGAAGRGRQTGTPVRELFPADKPLGISSSAPKWLDVASALSSSAGLLQSLHMFLEALEGVESVIPKDKFLAITSAVFYQVRGAYPCTAVSLLAKSQEDCKAQSP